MSAAPTPAELNTHDVPGDDALTAAAVSAARRADPANYGPIPLRTLSDLLAADGRRSRLERWVKENADVAAKDPLTSPAREVMRDVPDARYHFGPGSPHAAAVAAIQADGGLPSGTGDALAAACYVAEDVTPEGVAAARRAADVGVLDRKLQRLRDAKAAALRGDPMPSDAAAAFDAVQLPGGGE